MREFKFIFIHPEDFPVRFAVWEDGQVPSSTPSFRTLEFHVFHYDYFKASVVAEWMYYEWCREHGYKARN